MTLALSKSGAICGALVRGVDLAAPLDPRLIAEIRAAWLEHRVLAFTDQNLDDDALERFTLAMGGFGVDPFFEPIAGHEHIAAITREADETSPLFAESWHSDWSFLETPPAGTCLLAIELPPTGGDTLFSDQVAAFAALPQQRKSELRRLTAIHSASRGYAPDGLYGANDTGRSMAIRPGETARARQAHPLVKRHGETGEEVLFCSLSYTVAIAGMDDSEALALLIELQQWCEREEFVYRHKWEPDMLLMWDNRAVNHKASGGYEGYRRELHRTTIAAPG